MAAALCHRKPGNLFRQPLVPAFTDLLFVLAATASLFAGTAHCSNGEFNAGSRKEVMQAIATLMGAASRGEVSGLSLSKRQGTFRANRLSARARFHDASTDAATQTVLLQKPSVNPVSKRWTAGFGPASSLQQGDHRSAITPDSHLLPDREYQCSGPADLR